MFIVIVSPSNTIVFKKFIGESKKPIEYLLINASLDTQEDLIMDGYVAKSKLFSSGHRLLISHRITDKIPKKFIQLLDQYFIQDMLNPYVNDNESLSSEFSDKVNDAVNKALLKFNFSI